MPAVPLTVSVSGSDKIPVLGLVDSGADSSTFPIELAPRLEIDISECHHVSGWTLTEHM